MSASEHKQSLDSGTAALKEFKATSATLSNWQKSAAPAKDQVEEFFKNVHLLYRLTSWRGGGEVLGEVLGKCWRGAANGMFAGG